MHLRLSTMTAMLGLAMVAGCATHTNFVQRDLDWSQVPIRRIRNLPDNFEPAHTVLRVNQPVRLILTNGFGPTTDFISTFFNHALYRSTTGNPGVMVRLDPAQAAEFDVVPVKRGVYSITALALAQDASGSPNGFILVQ